MLLSRLYTPPKGELLYHYCGIESFLAIVESGRLRFGDLNMMNDHSEHGWGYHVFEEAATRLLQKKDEKPQLEGLGVEFFDQVDAIISPKQFISLGFTVSFSKQPDVLSQWRAYSQDGKGCSIGFFGERLAKMPVTLLEILYDYEQQIQEMMIALAAIYLGNKEATEPWARKFKDDCYLLGCYLNALKHPSFAEEQEIRALHEVRVVSDGRSMRLVDEGGVADGVEVLGETVQFRARESAVVAYLDIPFARDNEPSIGEVWLGPKNMNGPVNFRLPLGAAGHRDVAIRCSPSPYR